MIRILIVDDQKSARENINHILQQDQSIIVVGLAGDGHEAVKLAATLNPDVILMDLEMPNLDGLSATKLITQQNSKINIIILTVQDRKELLVQALNAGAKGYLLKGVDSQEILNTIHLIYEGNPFLEVKSNKPEELSSVKNSNGYQYRDAIPIVANSHKTFPDELYLEKISERRKFDFLALLAVLKRRYIPALMGFSGVLLGAILYLIFAPRSYQATASISLEDRQESVSELGKNLSSVIGSNEYSPLASQAELIRSKPVLNDALKNIANEKSDYLINDNLMKQIKLKDISPAAIQANLDIKIIPNTNILEVSYVNPDPELASFLLNEIINAVIARNTDIIRSEASSVRQFLEKEVSKQRNELIQLETAENRYREQKGIVAIDNQTANLVNRLNDLETQEQNLLTQIKEQEAKVNNLKQIARVNDAESAYIEGRIGQDSQLERLRSQLTDVEAELAAARSNFTDNNPTVIALLEKRDKISNLYQKQVSQVLGEEAAISPSKAPANGISQTDSGLGQEVFSQLITNQTQLEATRDKLQETQIAKEKLENQIALLPAKVQSLTELVRQKTQADESLKFLQRNLEEARIAEAQLVSNIQVVELATVPSFPSSPQIPMVLAIASVIGIILAVGIILLLEKIDSTLYDGKETEWQLNIPFLTSLPNLSDTTINLRKIQSFLNNRELYEPYRSLLKKLESRLENRLKVIVVTSATSQEGKSVVTSHLGALSAMLSRRTLIIDAHLSQPEQYRLFDVKLQPGLREVVIESLNLDRAVQPTKIKNLSVLTAGISTENSFTILESPKIKKILEQAAIQYDLVIIDAPPVNSSCDAYTLSKYSDGLVMVTRPLHTNKKLLEQAVEDLKRNKASIIGFVINRAKNQNPVLKSDRDDIKRKLLLLPGSSQTNKSHQGTKEVSQP